MKQKVLLVHGWGGSDFPHWQSWLAGEIAKDYGTVCFAKLQDMQLPNKDAWAQQLKEHLESFDPDVVICHSIANILWFHLCNETKLPQVRKLYLVAPPSLQCDIEELKSFFPVDIPHNLYAQEVILIASTNDPYMTLKEAQTLGQSLGVEMKVLQDAGHINAESGYGEWPWILQDLKDLESVMYPAQDP